MTLLKSSADTARPSAFDSSASQSSRLHASPYAKKTAAELGVELAELTGTGPCGRIVWRDVNAAAREKPRSGGTAGFYTTVDARELLVALESLGDALSLSAFVLKAVERLEFPASLRFTPKGVEGALPVLRRGESAAFAVSAPEGGKIRLHLAYSPAALDDNGAANLLLSLCATMENPLSLLL